MLPKSVSQVSLAFGAIVSRRRMRIALVAQFWRGGAGDRANSGTNSNPPPFATVGQVRYHAFSALPCYRHLRVGILFSECMCGKISRLHRRKVIRTNKRPASEKSVGLTGVTVSRFG